MAARLLIDGYNLLHASDVFVSAGPPTLERTRTAFLSFLAASLDEKQCRRTTVVFDATQAPPGLPHALSFAGMSVLFSRGGQDADALLEELLENDKAPREILVVSSDHRVQRAARQHGAKFADSDVWLRQLRERQTTTELPHRGSDDLNALPEVQLWLREFGDVDPQKLSVGEVPAPRTKKRARAASPETKAKSPRKRKKASRPKLTEKPNGGFANPFPPGYAEDVIREEEGLR